MYKKTLNNAQITGLCLTIILIISCFSGFIRFANAQSIVFSTQLTGSASEIAALENSIEKNGGWNSSLQTIYDGIALGQTTVNDLQNAVDSITVTSTSAAEEMFYWYHELSKFGVSINATTIEAALNEVQMLPAIAGLPYDYSNSGVDSFLLYNRYDLYAYQWAAQLGYETSKWNISQAYTVFDDAVKENGEPVLCVESNGKGWGIGYGPRYYDEGAETIDMYLIFWQIGVSDALTQAEDWWNWINSNLWAIDSSTGTGYYKYALGWNTFECETGGFDQIIWQLYRSDPSITNGTNLLTDLLTRFLSQGWSSPQWSNYVVQHAVGNSQKRLENTIMAWSSLLGFYGNMTSTMQSQVRALLDGEAGPAPAWSLLLQSGLYDNSTNMFRLHDDDSPSVEATADAAVLMMLISTAPLNGSLAVPMDDSVYEDINNVIDGGISNINLTARTITLTVSQPGTFLSTFGTDIFEYNLNSTGVWQLTFADDWNSITNETLESTLPNSRVYLGQAFEQILNAAKYTISASSDTHSIIIPSGLVEEADRANQTFTYYVAGGYSINQILVDNIPVPITGAYTFTNLNESHTISVSTLPDVFMPPFPNPSPTPAATQLPPPSFVPTPTPSLMTSPSPRPSLSPTITPPQTSTAPPTPSSTTISPAPSAALAVILSTSFSLAAILGFSIVLLLYFKKRKARIR